MNKNKQVASELIDIVKELTAKQPTTEDVLNNPQLNKLRTRYSKLMRELNAYYLYLKKAGDNGKLLKAKEYQSGMGNTLKKLEETTKEMMKLHRELGFSI